MKEIRLGSIVCGTPGGGLCRRTAGQISVCRGSKCAHIEAFWSGKMSISLKQENCLCIGLQNTRWQPPPASYLGRKFRANSCKLVQGASTDSKEAVDVRGSGCRRRDGQLKKEIGDGGGICRWAARGQKLIQGTPGAQRKMPPTRGEVAVRA